MFKGKQTSTVKRKLCVFLSLVALPKQFFSVIVQNCVCFHIHYCILLFFIMTNFSLNFLKRSMFVCANSLQSCRTLCNPMCCSLPGSSVHRDSPGKNTGVGCHALLPDSGIKPASLTSPVLAGGFFTTSTT